MATIINPKFKNVDNLNKPYMELPIRSDNTTVTKYMDENQLGSYSSYEPSDVKFSNSYGQLYNIYRTDISPNKWFTEFGYDTVVESINY